tara:strand:- start:823 stop:2412 length:1590 start_codon:yes stop_codon:yes gene_type:complete
VTIATANSLSDVPPLPGDNDAEVMRQQQRERRNVLEGKWLDSLIDELSQQFVGVRQMVMGKPTMARNLARTIYRQLSALYDQPPEIGHHDAHDSDEAHEAVETYSAQLNRARLWQMGTRLQQRTLFIREGCMAVDIIEDNGVPRLAFRDVPVDYLYIEASVDDPARPALLMEAVPRVMISTDSTGKVTRTKRWTLDSFDLRGDVPEFRVLLPGGGSDPVDITKTIFPEMPEGGFTGDAYPFRWTQGDRAGSPYIPHVIYHAEATGRIWDAWSGIEALEATKIVAVLWTFWLHAVRDASWAQRWTVNAHLRGGSLEGDDKDFTRHANVPADPSSIMQFATGDPMQSAQMGQWDPAVDPERLEVAVSSFERGTAAHFDLSTGDFQKQSSESGYAIALKRQSVREAQARMRPQFEAGDVELLAKGAALSNVRGLNGETQLPEDGWRVAYKRLPMSEEERRGASDLIDSMAKLGIKPSPVWALQRMLGIERAEAQDIMKQWTEDLVSGEQSEDEKRFEAAVKAEADRRANAGE